MQYQLMCGSVMVKQSDDLFGLLDAAQFYRRMYPTSPVGLKAAGSGDWLPVDLERCDCLQGV